jgi:hypothetical protein
LSHLIPQFLCRYFWPDDLAIGKRRIVKYP